MGTDKIFFNHFLMQLFEIYSFFHKTLNYHIGLQLMLFCFILNHHQLRLIIKLNINN